MPSATPAEPHKRHRTCRQVGGAEGGAGIRVAVTTTRAVISSRPRVHREYREGLGSSARFARLRIEGDIGEPDLGQDHRQRLEVGGVRAAKGAKDPVDDVHRRVKDDADRPGLQRPNFSRDRMLACQRVRRLRLAQFNRRPNRHPSIRQRRSDCASACSAWATSEPSRQAASPRTATPSSASTSTPTRWRPSTPGLHPSSSRTSPSSSPRGTSTGLLRATSSARRRNSGLRRLAGVRRHAQPSQREPGPPLRAAGVRTRSAPPFAARRHPTWWSCAAPCCPARRRRWPFRRSRSRSGIGGGRRLDRLLQPGVLARGLVGPRLLQSAQDRHRRGVAGQRRSARHRSTSA